MVSVRYCCRSAEGVSRETVQLPPACLTQQVSAARAAAAHLLGLTPSQIELVYRGRPLLDGRPMASYELSATSMLHAFRRPPAADTAAAAPVAAGQPDGSQLSRTLQSHSQDPARRHALQQRLGRPEVLDRLLASVPGLAEDPIAVALLQEPALLLQFASPRSDIGRLVARHPVLAAASSQLAAVLSEGSSSSERARAGPSGARPAAGAMAGSFDDDEGDDEPGAAGSNPPPITRAQLASALAAAAPGLSAPPLVPPRQSTDGAAAAPPEMAPATAPAPASALAQAPAPAPASGVAPARPWLPTSQQQQQPAADVISPEMVSAALREAMRALPGAQRESTAAPAPAPTPAPAAAPVAAPAAAASPTSALAAAGQPQVADDSAVWQLLELGITDDEALVRQALQVSDGNIDHAVEFIYSSMQ